MNACNDCHASGTNCDASPDLQFLKQQPILQLSGKDTCEAMKPNMEAVGNALCYGAQIMEYPESLAENDKGNHVYSQQCALDDEAGLRSKMVYRQLDSNIDAFMEDALEKSMMDGAAAADEKRMAGTEKQMAMLKELQKYDNPCDFPGIVDKPMCKARMGGALQMAEGMAEGMGLSKEQAKRLAKPVIMQCAPCMMQAFDPAVCNMVDDISGFGIPGVTSCKAMIAQMMGQMTN